MGFSFYGSLCPWKVHSSLRDTLSITVSAPGKCTHRFEILPHPPSRTLVSSINNARWQLAREPTKSKILSFVFWVGMVALQVWSLCAIFRNTIVWYLYVHFCMCYHSHFLSDLDPGLLQNVFGCNHSFQQDVVNSFGHFKVRSFFGFLDLTRIFWSLQEIHVLKVGRGPLWNLVTFNEPMIHWLVATPLILSF